MANEVMRREVPKSMYNCTPKQTVCVPAFKGQSPVVLMTINDEDVDIMIIMHTDGDYGDATHVRIGGGDVKDEQVGPDKSCPLH